MSQQKKKRKAESRKAIISLSVVSIVLAAVFVNEQVSKSQRPQYLIAGESNSISDLNRAIASADPMNPFRDLEWEKELVQKLAKQNPSVVDREPAAIGRPVSTIEQLRFGALAGKYRIEDQSIKSEVKIRQIDYVPSEDSEDRALYLNPEVFLKDYGALLAVDFQLFDRANPSQDQVREYRLLDSQKKVVGRASFVVDDEGRFISLKVAEIAN